MTFPRRAPLFLLALASALTAHAELAAPNWTELKPGLTGDEAVKHLGEPLIRTYGRGFEVWIYDGKGEAVFAGGPLKEWTVGQPTPASLARPASNDVLIRPVPRLRLPSPTMYARPTLPQPTETRFRYKY